MADEVEETEEVEEGGFPFRSQLHVHEGQVAWLASEKGFDADEVDDDGAAVWSAAEIVAAAYATRVEWRKTSTYRELVEEHRQVAEAEAAQRAEAAAARKAEREAAAKAAAKAAKEAKESEGEKPAATKATKATKAAKPATKATKATKATTGGAKPAARRGRRGAAATKPAGEEDPFA